MTVTLTPFRLPSQFDAIPAHAVKIDGNPRGVLYRIEHMDGSQTWYGMRWHDEVWYRFDSKQDVIGWIERTAKPHPGEGTNGGSDSDHQ